MLRIFETDQAELNASHDDALEAPTNYETKVALSQEVWAVFEPMVRKSEGAGDGPTVADAQIDPVCLCVSKGKAWKRWNMSKAAGEPPLPPPSRWKPPGCR